MLHRSSEKATHCYLRAVAAKEKAAHAATLEERLDNLEIEARWLRLAQSYELAERAALFLARAERRRQELCAYCFKPTSSRVASVLAEGIENRTFSCDSCGRSYTLTVEAPGGVSKGEFDLSRRGIRAGWRDAPDHIADVIRDEKAALLVDGDADRPVQRAAVVVNETSQDVLWLPEGRPLANGTNTTL